MTVCEYEGVSECVCECMGEWVNEYTTFPPTHLARLKQRKCLIIRQFDNLRQLLDSFQHRGGHVIGCLVKCLIKEKDNGSTLAPLELGCDLLHRGQLRGGK